MPQGGERWSTTQLSLDGGWRRATDRRAGYAGDPDRTRADARVDVVAGAGHIDTMPSTAEQFYGGNSASQFLYRGILRNPDPLARLRF